MALLYRDRTARLKQMFFEVQNEVGLGRHEEAYHRACVLWLQSHRMPFASKPPHRLMLGEDEAHVLYPDLVLWDSITVELKALPRVLGRGDAEQLFDYLRCRGDRLGILVNMGFDWVSDERFVYDPPTTQMIEDWSYWCDAIGGRDRELGVTVRDALRFLYQTHGTGYGAAVLERLMLCALWRTGLGITVRPTSKAHFHGVEVHESQLDCLLVDGRLLVAYSTLFDNVQFSINRGLSFMRALGLEWGIAVDFGKAVARVSGLRQRICCHAAC